MAKPLVMIIGDDKSFGDVITKKVCEVGYDVVQAFSAKEAKQALLEQKVQPVLVLCNTNLPDISGLNFFRETLIRNLNLNICMVTNKVERIELLEALQLGAIDFINRPLQPSFYSDRLARLVEIGQRKASVKNVLAQNADYTKAEQMISVMRAHNSVKKPA